jgi:translation initiation factor 2-alpha kinase 4
MPVLAIDVPPPVFEAITKSSTWVTDDEVWRPISSAFPTQQSAYAQHVREAVAKRKADHHFILLFAVREERAQLLSL